MKASKFTEAQKAFILKQGDEGTHPSMVSARRGRRVCPVGSRRGRAGCPAKPTRACDTLAE